VFILGQILDGPMALQQQNKWAGWNIVWAITEGD
jgi:hypothetical protein